jgi:hypothetical protein
VALVFTFSRLGPRFDDKLIGPRSDHLGSLSPHEQQVALDDSFGNFVEFAAAPLRLRA